MSTEKKLPNEKDQTFVVKNQPGETGGAFQQCPVTTCRDHEAPIREICRSNAWPPGHKVLVCSVDGNCCYCECK